MELSEKSIDPDPIAQFRRWYDEAVAAGRVLPEAVTLATSTPEGNPSARIMLLRGFDQEGFVFFTNYASRKAAELDRNPAAALVWHWPEVQRQVRIEGSVERIPVSESQEYFHSRPRGSQVGAWASRQSAVIRDRNEMEERFANLEKAYKGGEVPYPEFWGGYRVAPKIIEFWQGRDDRLHDRLRYTREGSGWKIERLSP